jgi:hypothetical protein
MGREGGSAVREARWSEAVAVGSLTFLEKVKRTRIQALHRELEQVDGTYTLRESSEAYRAQFDLENGALSVKNALPWKRIGEVPQT